MILELPTNYIGHLKAIQGCRLLRVIRWLYEDDLDRPDFQQDADGPTSLIFDLDLSLHVQADQERQGLVVSDCVDFRYGSGYRQVDVSKNRFWADRVGARVVRFGILKSKKATSDYPIEFGLELYFDNKSVACFEYIDTEEWPDTLRVREFINEDDSERIFIG